MRIAILRNFGLILFTGMMVLFFLKIYKAEYYVGIVLASLAITYFRMATILILDRRKKIITVLISALVILSLFAFYLKH